MPISIQEAYQVLELEVGADIESVKKQYKKLALKTHPDKNPHDPEANKKFLLVSESYKRIVEPESFEGDDCDHEPSEEEMESMFNMMFADMFGMAGINGSSIPFEFFDILESMMMEEEYDMHEFGDEDESADVHMENFLLESMLMNELLNGGSCKSKGKGSKKPAKKSSKASKKKKESDSEDWETDDSQENQNFKDILKLSGKPSKSNVFSGFSAGYDDDESFDDEDLLMELMMGQLLGGGGGMMKGMGLEHLGEQKKSKATARKGSSSSTTKSRDTKIRDDTIPPLKKNVVKTQQRNSESENDSLDNVFNIGDSVLVYNK